MNFEESKSNLFYIFKNSKILKYLENNLRKNKLYRRIFIKNNCDFKKIVKADFDLIINCDANNKISKDMFFRKINKNYNSKAFTTIIKHKKIPNNTALQIFTKN